MLEISLKEMYVSLKILKNRKAKDIFKNENMFVILSFDKTIILSTMCVLQQQSNIKIQSCREICL